MNREIVLDTETTGLSPREGHRIVEIGCVELINHVATGRYYHQYINPERSIPEEAFKVHGLSDAFLKDYPLFHEIVDEFLNFIGDAPLVIHNAKFDMAFLNAELCSSQRPLLPMSRAIDTVLIARQRFPGSPVNLNALCRRFNIDLSGRELHGALLDSELLAECYLELMGGRQPELLFEKQKNEEKQKVEEKSFRVERPFRKARSFPLKEEEKKRHREMLKKLNNPLWEQII